MKQFRRVTVVIGMIICLTSCNLKNDTFTSGKWHIVDYRKRDNEKRNFYSGFNFTFSKDHHIVAVKDHRTYTGDWSVLESDLTDDAPAADINFNIRFTSKIGLSGLNGEWTIVRKSDNFLSLIHMDTENTDFLIFEK